MTSETTMTRQELLELAALDAFGLLDEYEADSYTRCFQDAPVGVQEELIQLQAQLVSDDSLLPKEEPRPQLRQRVLEAVAQAIDEETSNLKPLAMIGKPRNSMTELIGQFPLSRSGQFWRAAAFALAGMVVVIAYFWSNAYHSSIEITKAALLEDMRGQLKEYIDPNFEDFVSNPYATVIPLMPVDTTAHASIGLWLNDRSDEALLVAIGLPDPAEEYTLSVQSESGKTVLGTLNQHGALAALRLSDINTNLLRNATIQITNSLGQVLYKST